MTSDQMRTSGSVIPPSAESKRLYPVTGGLPFTETGVPVLLTVVEAAKVLRISRTTAFLMCKRRELPTLRIAGRTMIPAAQLLTWIDERVVWPTDGARLVPMRRLVGGGDLLSSAASQVIEAKKSPASKRRATAGKENSW